MRYIRKFNESGVVSYTNENVTIGDIYDESDIYKYIQRLHRNEDDFYDGDIGERIEYFKKYKVLDIPVDKIRMEDYELDYDYVREYIKEYKKTGIYPPIVIGDPQFGYDIIDGNHRANALRKAGLKSIICFVGIDI